MSKKKQQLACLYTKHKTQKRKIWKDGRLVLNANSSRAILHDANPPQGSGDPSLGECEITPCQLQAILRQYHDQNSDTNVGASTTGLLETERYLVEIEGPWTNNPSVSVASALHVPKRLPNGKKSSTMKKVLTSKFQKPKSYVPPPPGTQRSRMEEVLAKRRRPLQPGELVARHYGGDGYGVSGSRGGFDDPRSNPNRQHHQDHRRDRHPQHSVSRGNISENNLKGPPLFRSEIQRHGPEQPPPSTENPIDSMQSAFGTLQDLNSLVPVGKVGSSRGVGPAPTGSQFRSVQQEHQRYRRPVRQRNNNATAFVQNEFNSAKYYGTDEEEEDDEDRGEELLPQAPSFAQALVDGRTGEQRQKDNSSDIQQCDNRKIRKIGEGPIGAFTHRVDNTYQKEEMQLQQQTDRRHGHQNQCLSSSATSTPPSSRNTNENDNKTSNDSHNDSRLVSKAHIEQQSESYKIESYLSDQNHHRKKELDEDEEESEEDDEEFSDNDIGAPVSFRLKPIESLTDKNKDKKDAIPPSVSGNRLLALFGARFDEPVLQNDNNADTISKKIESDRSNEISCVNKENSMLTGASEGASKPKIRGYFDAKGNESGGDAKKDIRTNNKKEGKENLSGDSGFYLAPAATSSEESSDDESSDEE